jgi:hypothetical protein
VIIQDQEQKQDIGHVENGKSMIKLSTILLEIIFKSALKEEIDPSEAYNDLDSINTLVDGKRNIAFLTRKSNNPDRWNQIQQIIKDNFLKTLYVEKNPFDAYIIYRSGSENEAMELKKIAEKYDGYLSSKASDEDTRRIGHLLGYRKDKVEEFIEKRNKK